MKKLFLAMIIFMLCASCTMVRFENPQPLDVVASSYFPKQMHGSFISDEQDTLEIDSVRFHFRNGEEINMIGDLTLDHTILKQTGKYLIINLHEEEGWDIFPIRLKKDRITVYYTSLSSKVEELMEELRVTSEVKEVADSTGHLKYYLINPTPEEFQILLKKKLYDEELVFKRIK